MAHHYRDTYRHADPRERPRPGELSSLLWVDVWGWEACGADSPPPPNLMLGLQLCMGRARRR